VGCIVRPPEAARGCACGREEVKRSSTRAALVAVLAAVASALGATACGNTASNPDPEPKADSNHGGGAAAVSAVQPPASGTGGPASGTGGPASGTGGRASAGTGQTASAGSESPVGGGGGGGGVPALHPLIVGDDVCPAEAPRRLDGCPEAGASCVYRGLTAMIHGSDQPFRCTCDGDNWACALSGENGEEICPLLTELPGPNVACPTSGEPCDYWVPGYLGLAKCYCMEDDAAGGAAGAGGAGPSSVWSCLL
jgi:hypothetical protein